MNKRKTILTAILMTLTLAVPTAGAQGIYSPATSEVNFRNSLWWDTDNSAALAFRPINLYGDLSASYQREDGNFHRAMEAENSDIAKVRSSGAANVAGSLMWGEFSISDIFERGVKHNALYYEIPEDMPYFVADTVGASRWNKQAYEMRARLSSPVLWRRLSFGIDLAYSDKVGAKQRDPRVETKLYDLSVKPSLAWKISEHSLLGLNGLYERGLERSTPTNKQYRFNQGVFLTRGLGIGSGGVVGGNSGLNTFYYNRQSYGGGLQYEFTGGGLRLLAEAGFAKKNIDIYEQPTLPRRRGSTKSTLADGGVSLLWGKNFSDKLAIQAMYRATDGIEHQQQYINETLNQHWETIVANEMSDFDRIGAMVSYNHLFGADKARGYSYKAGIRAGYDKEDDSYLMPACEWNWSAAYAGLDGGAQWVKGRSSWLLEAGVLYNKSLSSEYIFGGDAEKNAKIVDIYREDLLYRSFDYLRADLAVSYSLKGKKVSYVWEAGGYWYESIGSASVPTEWGLAESADRLLARFSFGIIF